MDELLREIPQAESVGGGSESERVSLETRADSELSSLTPRLVHSGHTSTTPKLRSRNPSSNEFSTSHRKLSFKFKGSISKVVKKNAPSSVLNEIFKVGQGSRHRSATRVSFSLEEMLLDTLATAPQTMMDLRISLQVSHRNIESLERRGFIDSFWGPRGVGRMYRITRKGSMELKHLKMVSSIVHEKTEKPLITLRKITAPLPV